MRADVAVSRAEYEAATKLKRVPAQTMLLVARCPGALAGLRIFPPQDVEVGRSLEPRRSVGNALIIHEQREIDARLLTKLSGISGIAHTHRGKLRTGCFELAFVFAQLRDVLAAEDSSVVTKKNEYCWMLLPKRAQPYLASARIGQSDPGKS